MKIHSYDQSSTILLLDGNYRIKRMGFILDPKPVINLKNLIYDKTSLMKDQFQQWGTYDFGEKGVFHTKVEGNLAVVPDSPDGKMSLKKESNQTSSVLFASLCGWGSSGMQMGENNGRVLPSPASNTQDAICRYWEFQKIDGVDTLCLCVYTYPLDSRPSPTAPLTWSKARVNWYQYQIDRSRLLDTRTRVRATTTVLYPSNAFSPSALPQAGATFQSGGIWGTWTVKNGYKPLTPAKKSDSGLVQTRLYGALKWLELCRFTDESETTWDDLTIDVVNQCKAVDSNMWTLLPEIINLRNLATEIGDMAAKLAKPTIRRLADAELSLKYGFQLTVKDLMSIAKRTTRYRIKKGAWTSVHSIRRNERNETGHYGTAHIVSYATIKLWYNSQPRDPFKALLWNLSSLGVMPSLENMWDMVPYSFCVDWLINLSKTCSQIDTGTLITKLVWKLCLYGQKTMIAMDCMGIPDLRDLVFGTINFTLYRRYAGGLRTPTPTLSAASGSFNNYAEAGAIITQLVVRK